MAKLNAKQRLFVKEYLQDLNATRAAKAAGYSAKTAGSIGHELLKKPEIAEALRQSMGKYEAELDLSLDRLFKELGRQALLDPRKFYREDGTLKLVPELDDDSAAGLAGMEVEEAYEHFGKGQAKPIGELKKIKFADKGLAIERLLKYKHRIGDKLEVTGLDEIADLIAAARKRSA